RFEAEAQQARDLRDVIETLAQSLEPLRPHQPAARFIESFRTIVEAYFEPSAVLSAAIGQIDQLGTIDAVGGGFTLESFAGALRANLDAARYRESSVGEGVLVGDYRLAAGLSFRHAIICGAYEGVFPAGPGVEPLVEDRFWQELRRSHPLLEDAALRSERAQDQARRAISCAGEELVLTAPLQAGAAGRDHYPSHLMLDAARGHDAGLESASQLRRAPASAWLRRSPSPLAAILTGRPVDVTEMRLRTSVVARREGRPAHAGHPLSRALAMLTARRGAAFSAFDGNLAELGGDDLIPSGAVSPTSLEYYATCGFRYYLRSVLRLHPPDEPDDRETIDPLERGSIVHNTLDEFFKLQLGRGRPAVNEPWNEADRVELLDILERHLDEARQRGKTGLDVFAEHERRRLRADMSAFLDKDTEFRFETGARPDGFEVPLPEVEVAGLRMRGYVDRIDRTEDGKKAWVIDYKTGSISSYEGMKDDDPLMGGTKLQLPVYLAAVQGADATPLYWFISGAAGFARKEFRTTPENLQRFDETLAAILDGLKRGVFPPVSGDADDFFGGWKNCQWCDFKRLCSRRRDDEFEAKKDDPTLAPWLRVGATARGEAP
ncbi:MAG TPA: PD-(D/E)XK nuclease family protein, partial [Dehalococcoidia bacterium]|nr:PD-(D/E)XK nuclease family protein [Dehalococcoidia bacterium]